MTFIIPKDFKKGKYILNRYRIKDLIILASGCISGCVTILSMVMMTLNTSKIIYAVIGIIVGILIIGTVFLLTTNVSYYFNLLEYYISIIDFYKNNHEYIWTGFDYTYEEEERKINELERKEEKRKKSQKNS